MRQRRLLSKIEAKFCTFWPCVEVGEMYEFRSSAYDKICGDEASFGHLGDKDVVSKMTEAIGKTG